MPAPNLPYLLDAGDLNATLESGAASSLAMIYVGKHEHYLESHIPKTRWIEAAKLNRGVPPAPGLLPDAMDMERVLATIGLDQDAHVVCHDDNGGTNGARLAWVLEAMGHRRLSMLDGGLGAWKSAGFPTAAGSEAITPARHPWTAAPDPAVVADKQHVLEALGNPAVRILDSRSEDEYLGRKTRSARKGRIPGARNLDWMATVDSSRDNRLLPPRILEKMLAERGIDRTHETIVHCQTHQRSAHSFVMLRSLGFEHVRAYAGSWMEWAADEALPIICEDPGS